MLRRPGRGRDRLVRHELTHVAVGEHDDRAPVWLAEGHRGVGLGAPDRPDAARGPGRRGRGRPSGVRPAAGGRHLQRRRRPRHYALSWWACEYLAAHDGPGALWSLLDALDRPGTRGAADRARVLRERTGLDEARLAERAGGLLLATYAPVAASRG